MILINCLSQVAAQSEMRAVRKGDRIATQNRRRKEAEAARRQNDALLREWVLLAREREQQERACVSPLAR